MYSFLSFENREHFRFANIPGMFDRTITINSLGKMFSATGWRTGYVVGPEDLIKGITLACENINFTVFRPV